MSLTLRLCLGAVVFMGLLSVLGGVTCDNRCGISDVESYPALCVLVVDAETGQPLQNAIVQATDGQTTETLPHGIPDPIVGRAVQRGGYVVELGYCGVSKIGTYSVSVQAEGYQTEQVAEVRMLEHCVEQVPVLPVDLRVELTRSESP